MLGCGRYDVNEDIVTRKGPNPRLSRVQGKGSDTKVFIGMVCHDNDEQREEKYVSSFYKDSTRIF